MAAKDSPKKEKKEKEKKEKSPKKGKEDKKAKKEEKKDAKKDPAKKEEPKADAATAEAKDATEGSPKKGSPKRAKTVKKKKPILSGLEDAVFVNDAHKDLGIGAASYHFVRKADMADVWTDYDLLSSYISYEDPPDGYNKYQKKIGRKPLPTKMEFKQITYDPETRTFIGTIEWGKTFGYVSTSDYKLIFSEDLTKVESGEMRSLDEAGLCMKQMFFGEAADLHYKREDKEVVDKYFADKAEAERLAAEAAEAEAAAKAAAAAPPEMVDKEVMTDKAAKKAEKAAKKAAKKAEKEEKKAEKKAAKKAKKEEAE